MDNAFVFTFKWSSCLHLYDSIYLCTQLEEISELQVDCFRLSMVTDKERAAASPLSAIVKCGDKVPPTNGRKHATSHTIPGVFALDTIILDKTPDPDP